MAVSAGAHIVAPDVFRVLVEMETKKAQRLRYVVSVLYLGVDKASAGGPVTGGSLAQMVAPTIRSTDAVAASSNDSVAMLLIDAEDQNLPTILSRLTPGLENAQWSAGGASYPKTAASADELLD